MWFLTLFLEILIFLVHEKKSFYHVINLNTIFDVILKTIHTDLTVC